MLAETERLAGALHEAGPGARVQLAVAPCSPFSVTGRLMEESAALARRLGLPLHTHLAETVEEEAYCRRALRLHAGRVPGAARLARRTTSGARTASISPRRTSTASPQTGTGVAHCPTSNLRLGRRRRAGARSRRRGRPRRARCRRLCVERARRSLPRGQAGASRRARPRRPGRADRARGAPARDPRRRRGAAAATTSARSSPAGAPTSRSGGRTGSSSAARTTRVAALVLAGPHRVDRLLVGGEDVVRDGELVRADEDEIARRAPCPGGAVPRRALRAVFPRAPARWRACARRRFSGGHEGVSLSTHVLDTGAGRPAAGVRVVLYRGDEPVAAGETDADGRVRRSPTVSTQATTASSSTRRRRSSDASSSRSRSSEGHYHVPLLVSPYACASYRGS